MEEKFFNVELEIKAPSKEYVEKMLDSMSHADRIFSSDIVDPDEPRLEERIRYDKDWCGDGEHFVFESKWTNETEWGLDSAFKLFDFVDKNGEVAEKGTLINYKALTKIRELLKWGVRFYFSSK